LWDFQKSGLPVIVAVLMLLHQPFQLTNAAHAQKKYDMLCSSAGKSFHDKITLGNTEE